MKALGKVDSKQEKLTKTTAYHERQLTVVIPKGGTPSGALLCPTGSDCLFHSGFTRQLLSYNWVESKSLSAFSGCISWYGKGRHLPPEKKHLHYTKLQGCYFSVRVKTCLMSILTRRFPLSVHRSELPCSPEAEFPVFPKSQAERHIPLLIVTLRRDRG